MPHLDAPPATHELLSGSARLLVGTDGSLVLFRADKPDQPSVQGRAVLPWFLARQGAVATRADGDEGSESLELRWGNSAVLRVTPVGEESHSQGGPWTRVRLPCLPPLPPAWTRRQPGKGLRTVGRGSRGV